MDIKRHRPELDGSFPEQTKPSLDKKQQLNVRPNANLGSDF